MKLWENVWCQFKVTAFVPLGDGGSMNAAAHGAIPLVCPFLTEPPPGLEVDQNYLKVGTGAGGLYGSDVAHWTQPRRDPGRL